MFCRELEVMSQIEFISSQLMRPRFKKEVRVVVAVIPKEIWLQLKKRFLSQCHPEETKKRAKSLPRLDMVLPHGYFNEQFHLDRVGWYGVQIPSMLNEYWFRMKWLDSDGIVWRSWINYFDLLYDEFTQVLTMEFDFDLQFWSDTLKCWSYN